MSTPLQRPVRLAFTLTEILVVISIIVILIAILVPTVAKIRIAAQAADVKQQLSSIGAAIERYHGDFRAYPGPLSNDEIYQTDPAKAPKIFDTNGSASLPDLDKITMAENLVLGLLGGLRRETPSGGPAGPGVIVFDFKTVGQGPGNLNPRQPKKYSPYAEPVQLSWTDNQPTGGPNAPGPTSGYYVDDASLSRATAPMDSPIPEFVDRFTNPMPIIYLRARTAAKGVISDNVSGPATDNYQYDIAQYRAYVDKTGGATGQSIGVGKRIKRGDYYNPTLAANEQPFHGLTAPFDETLTLNAADKPGNYRFPFDAFPYFQDATIRPTDPGAKNATGTPRNKNGFILISAGADRVYGTTDDITSFGDVTQ